MGPASGDQGQRVIVSMTWRDEDVTMRSRHLEEARPASPSPRRGEGARRAGEGGEPIPRKPGMRPPHFRLTIRQIMGLVIIAAFWCDSWAYLQRWEARRAIMYQQ